MTDLDTAPSSRPLDRALWIDVRAALALCRAALSGLSAATPEIRAVVARSLKEEAAIVEVEGAPGASAVRAMIDDARRMLDAA